VPPSSIGGGWRSFLQQSDEEGVPSVSLSENLKKRPDAVLLLAEQLLEAGEARKTIAILQAALAQAPANGELAWLLNQAYSRAVPDWHFKMLHEPARNQAYQEAISRAVRPGMTVLEIGTGSGLLAMMAARAGAKRVVTCEADWRLAEAATQIVKSNGFADKVTVLHSHSTSLDAERDLDGGADVLVAEIFGNMLLNEAVLPSFEHAKENLLKPGAQVIPASGSFEIALAEHEGVEKRLIDSVCGFDLSVFNRHSPLSYSIKVGDEGLHLRGASRSLFSFDFQHGRSFPAERATIPLLSMGGSVNGIVGWIRLQMDERGVYENRPNHGTVSAWAARFTRLPSSVAFDASSEVLVHGSHDRHAIRVWVDQK
jgi:type II protein arginine methyltransferase